MKQALGSANPMAITEGCRCGACRWTIDYPATPVIHACHCRDCQMQTGRGSILAATPNVCVEAIPALRIMQIFAPNFA